MRKNNIEAALNNLSKVDVYSLILFALWQLKDVPEYSTLSELSYVLDNSSLIRFLTYYEGMTIKIPTKKEFNNLLDALLLYQLINLENIPFEEALKNIKTETSAASSKELKENYTKIATILDNYNFSRN